MGRVSEIFFAHLTLCLCLTTPFSAVATTDNMASTSTDALTTALEFAKTERFDSAFSLLNKVETAKQSSYQYRFTKARILTWAQRYDEAAGEYDLLIQAYPNNPDVRVSVGYLELFRGNLHKAETYFNAVIDLHPDYEDAHVGLERTQAVYLNMAEANSPEPPKSPS